MVKGPFQADTPVLVRVHIHNALCDLTASIRETCGWPLRSALQRIAEEGCGVVVVLHQKEDPRALVNRIRHCCHQGREQESSPPASYDLRTHGLGAQILSDLGIRKMRVLSAPKKMHAISGFGLEVIEYVNNERSN